jgi:hypothetical protein
VWPKTALTWREGGVLFISVSFTWHLLKVLELIRGEPLVIVGGPATQLMPEFFKDYPQVKIGRYFPGVLQMLNPLAIRTTLGCPNKCAFCAIGSGKVEAGGLVELPDWPDLPIICDNNLLAASIAHFDRVMDRLEHWPEQVDFNQGLDARLLTAYHAERFGRLKHPKIRLALDHVKHWEKWLESYELLRSQGVNKSSIYSYALIGFHTDPDEAWKRCLFLEEYCLVNPMWYHSLSALEHNKVTKEQESWGWTKKERTKLMGYFYRRRGTIRDV